MVTLAYMTILLTTILYNALIDMYLHRTGFGEALANLYDMEFGTGRWILISELLLGLAASLLTDRKRRKQKKQQDSHESNA